VLGPPHDKKWIKKSDPTKGASEVYQLATVNGSEFALFAAIDALERGDEPEAQPFDEWFRVSEDKARRDPFFQQHYETGADWRRIEHDWLGPRDWFATVPPSSPMPASSASKAFARTQLTARDARPTGSK
jgi:hypothetical protein